MKHLLSSSLSLPRKSDISIMPLKDLSIHAVDLAIVCVRVLVIVLVMQHLKEDCEGQ